MYKSLFVLGCAAVLTCGCGGDTETAAVEQEVEYFTAEDVEAQVAPVPPPVPGAPVAASTRVDPTNNDEIFREYNDDGEMRSVTSILEKVVESYEQTREMAGGADNPYSQKTYPPLTNLQQLVTYRFLKALPAAPAGQKFVLDPKTLKVSLASGM